MQNYDNVGSYWHFWKNVTLTWLTSSFSISLCFKNQLVFCNSQQPLSFLMCRVRAVCVHQSHGDEHNVWPLRLSHQEGSAVSVHLHKSPSFAWKIKFILMFRNDIVNSLYSAADLFLMYRKNFCWCNEIDGCTVPQQGALYSRSYLNYYHYWIETVQLIDLSK